MSQVVGKLAYLRTDLPVFSSGDSVKVHQKVIEFITDPKTGKVTGKKERVQIFEGMVIGRHGGGGINATFTVRKISSGIGVERIYPLHSPNIFKLEVLKRAHVRKAQLTYVRHRADNQPRTRKGKK